MLIITHYKQYVYILFIHTHIRTVYMYNRFIKQTTVNAGLNFKDEFNAIHRTLYKFVEVKAIYIRAPLILYTGYLEAFGRHRGKPLDPLHADAF